MAYIQRTGIPGAEALPSVLLHRPAHADAGLVALQCSANQSPAAVQQWNVPAAELYVRQSADDWRIPASISRCEWRFAEFFRLQQRAEPVGHTTAAGAECCLHL